MLGLGGQRADAHQVGRGVKLGLITLCVLAQRGQQLQHRIRVV